MDWPDSVDSTPMAPQIPHMLNGFYTQFKERRSFYSLRFESIAEWVCRAIWAATRRPVRHLYPDTRLTQSRRRQAKHGSPNLPANPGPQALRICRKCGEPLKHGQSYCAPCSVTVSRGNLIEAAKLGQVATHSPKAEALRAATQRRHAAELKDWPSNKPDWLTEETYRETILPRLSDLTVPAISAALGVSEPYAADIRKGRCVPHRRHWQTLAQLVGVTRAGTI